MRPLRLELEGFTVYKRPQVIDFEKLNFFVIQGKTGSGKTSIVDAITFALYGKVPRYENKNATSLVLSKGSNKLRVVLDFSVDGKRYRIERFYRNKPREDLVRVEEEGRRLNLKKPEVEKWVQKITGLDYKTFTKVILLPQGEFDRFLKPSTPKERREILINLLNLEVFERIRKLASDTYKQIEGELTALKGEYETLKDLSEQDINRIEDERAEGERRLSLLKEEEEKLKDLLNRAREKETLERELKETIGKLEELADREDEIENLKDKLNTARRIQPYLPYLERLQFLEDEIRKLRRERDKLLKDRVNIEEELKQAEEAKNDVERRYSRLPDLRRELQEVLKEKDSLETVRRELLDIKIKEEEISKLKEKLKEKEKVLQDREERLRKGESHIAKTEKELKDLGFEEEEFEKLLREVERKTHLVEENEKLKRILQELEDLENEEKEAEEEILILKRDLEDKEESLRKESIKFFAHKIRTHLREGDTCPVCGGKVAEPLEDEHIIDLNDLERQVEDLKEKILLKEKELSFVKARKQNLSKEVEALRSKLKGWEVLLKMDLEGRLRELEEKKKKKRELEDRLKRYRERFNQLVKEREEALREVQTIRSRMEDLKSFVIERQSRLGSLKDLEEVERREKELARRAEELEREIVTVEEKREKIRAYIEDLTRRLIALETKLREIEISLGDKEKERKDVERKLVPLFKEFGDLEKIKEFQLDEREMEEIETRISEFEKSKEVLKENVERLRGKLKDFEGIPPAEVVEKELSEVRSDVEELLKKLGELKQNVERMREDLSRKRRIEERIKNLEKQLLVYSRLKDDLKSDRLPEFASSLMLSRIVDRASEYLFNFTNSYEFILDSKGDLAILDRIQGTERDVRSLSGGETFLASLSLALGVSDVLSANAPLESLFIDEGFGSLDEETRERVSDILELLKQKINRMVGIISHIPDLAERFHQRIVVKKHGDFSTVEIVY